MNQENGDAGDAEAGQQGLRRTFGGAGPDEHETNGGQTRDDGDED